VSEIRCFSNVGQSNSKNETITVLTDSVRCMVRLDEQFFFGRCRDIFRLKMSQTPRTKLSRRCLSLYMNNDDDDDGWSTKMT